MAFESGEANLTRIRDNQRRSRARRKQYIQDLERRCERYQLQGVEATREVQQAARKVLVENKLLRDLLRQNGFTDAVIDLFIEEHAAETPAGAKTSATAHDQAVQLLDSLLVPRPCYDYIDVNTKINLGVPRVQSGESSVSIPQNNLTPDLPTDHTEQAVNHPASRQIYFQTPRAEDDPTSPLSPMNTPAVFQTPCSKTWDGTQSELSTLGAHVQASSPDQLQTLYDRRTEFIDGNIFGFYSPCAPKSSPPGKGLSCPFMAAGLSPCGHHEPSAYSDCGCAALRADAEGSDFQFRHMMP